MITKCAYNLTWVTKDGNTNVTILMKTISSMDKLQVINKVTTKDNFKQWNDETESYINIITSDAIKTIGHGEY